MQQTIQHPNYQGEEQSTHTAARADTCIGNLCVTGTKVLVIAGISTGIVSRELAHAAALGQDGPFHHRRTKRPTLCPNRNMPMRSHTADVT
jgi:hypothetical protein